VGSSKKRLDLHAFNGKVYQTWVRNDDKIKMRVYDPATGWDDQGGQGKSAASPSIMANTGTYLIHAVRSLENTPAGNAQKVYWRKLGLTGSWSAWAEYGEATQQLEALEFQNEIYMTRINSTNGVKVEKFNGTSWNTSVNYPGLGEITAHLTKATNLLFVSFAGNASAGGSAKVVYSDVCTYASGNCSWAGEINDLSSKDDVVTTAFDGLVYQSTVIDSDKLRIRYYDTAPDMWSPAITIKATNANAYMYEHEGKLFTYLRSSNTAADGGRLVYTRVKNSQSGAAGWTEWDVDGYTGL
jgi:hypothetical protein